MELQPKRRVVLALLGLVVLASAFGLYAFGVLPFVPRSTADVKYSVIDSVGPPLVCTGWGQGNGPFRPVQTYPLIVADMPTYIAILRRVGLPPVLSPNQVVSVYREWLKLEAVHLTRDSFHYQFDMWPDGGSTPEALRHQLLGTVDLFGHVANVHQGTEMGGCLL